MRGFSLIEVLIAVAIFSSISIAATGILIMILHAQQRERAIRTVELEGNYELYQMTQSIRKASSITSPSLGASANSLTIAVSGISEENPTVIALSGTSVTLKKGAGVITSLASQNSIVTALTFSNITNYGTKGSVRITLVLNSATSTSNYSETFYTTVSLR